MFEFLKKIFSKKCPYCNNEDLIQCKNGNYYCKICNIDWNREEC